LKSLRVKLRLSPKKLINILPRPLMRLRPEMLLKPESRVSKQILPLLWKAKTSLRLLRENLILPRNK